MDLSGIRHEMDNRYCFALSRSTSCGASSKNPDDGVARFCVRIETAAGDMGSVILHLEDRYLYSRTDDLYGEAKKAHQDAPAGAPFHGRWSTAYTYPMRRYASDGVHDYYEAQVDINTLCTKYYFELHGRDGSTMYYSGYEFSSTEPTNPLYAFDSPQTSREESLFDAPDWAKNTIVYQIFPTAFAIDDETAGRTHDATSHDATTHAASETSGTVPATPETLAAEAASARARLAENVKNNPDWHGPVTSIFTNLHGTLRGIIEALPHIQELGAGAIYLNPVFVSPSPHKYDTVDYLHVDPSLGTDQDLIDLVAEAHRRGMRVILDGVFNHTSERFFAFQDAMKNGRDSKYWDWYWLDDWPLDPHGMPNYKTFAYYGNLPKLRTSNPEVQDYFIDVVLHWIDVAGVDGWRMDVGDEIDHVFWKRLRKAVHRKHADVILGGEAWHPAFDFLESDEWDTVMNYHFRWSALRFFANGEFRASDVVRQIGFMRGKLHPVAWPLMWNLLDSHDTQRFLHECGEDDAKHRLAMAMQMLSAGSPLIYYGDEYGLAGGADPDCRRGMPWDPSEQDAPTYEWYRALLRLRTSLPAVYEGEVLGMDADDEHGVITIAKSTRFLESEASHMPPFELAGHDALAEHRRLALAGPRITIVYHNSPNTDRLEGFEGTTDLITGRPFDGRLAPYQALVLGTK